MAYYVASLYFKQDPDKVNDNPFLYALPTHCTNGNTLAEDIERAFDSRFYLAWKKYFERDDVKFRFINETLATRAQLTKEQFMWGVCVIRSRSFR